MATVRLSPLQRHTLAWLWRQHHRTADPTAANYPALVRVFPTLAAEAAPSVRNLVQKGLVKVRHTPDGQMHGVSLPEAGWDWARRL